MRGGASSRVFLFALRLSRASWPLFLRSLRVSGILVLLLLRARTYVILIRARTVYRAREIKEFCFFIAGLIKEETHTHAHAELDRGASIKR